jgi:hypothetical protein
MSDKPSDVLGALPHSRPHRRSDKRARKPAVDSAPAAAEQARPKATPAAKPTATPATRAKSAPTTKPKPTPAAQAKPKATPAAAAKPRAVPATGRPKLVAVPPPEAPAHTAPTQFFTPEPGSRGRVAAQKATKEAADEKFDVLGTAIQAVAELAEIGISATARAIRGAVDRLPRP